MLIFNPLDNHTCEQIDDNALGWRGFNIEKGVMRRLVEDITGISFFPVFTLTVVSQSEAVYVLKDLHDMIMNGRKGFNKEEA